MPSDRVAVPSVCRAGRGEITAKFAYLLVGRTEIGERPGVVLTARLQADQCDRVLGERGNADDDLGRNVLIQEIGDATHQIGRFVTCRLR